MARSLAVSFNAEVIGRVPGLIRNRSLRAKRLEVKIYSAHPLCSTSSLPFVLGGRSFFLFLFISNDDTYECARTYACEA